MEKNVEKINKKVKLFLGIYNPFYLVSIIFIFLGLVFSIIFLPLTDFQTATLFKNKLNLAIIEGKITNIKRTLFSEASKNYKKQNIYKYSFNYSVNNVSYSFNSYTVGKKYKIDEIIKIEYLKNNPKIAKIIGTRYKPFSIYTSFVLIIPFLGFILIIFAYFYSNIKYKLLQDGILTEATVIKAKKKYLVLEYTDKTNKLYNQKNTLFAKMYKEKDTVKIKYDINNPKRIIIYDYFYKLIDFKTGEIKDIKYKILVFISLLFPFIFLLTIGIITYFILKTGGVYFV